MIEFFPLKASQPGAINIRFAGDCDVCGQPELYTYQLAEVDHDRGYNEETCGYFCQACGWGNAGSREKWFIPDA